MLNAKIQKSKTMSNIGSNFRTKLNLMEKKFTFFSIFGVLIFMVQSLSMTAQCTNPTFNNCTNRNIVLDPGECTTGLVPPLTAVNNCNVDRNLVVTQNISLASIPAGYGCFLGNTHFYQVFPAGTHGITTSLNISSVSLGVFQAFNNPIVQVRIYLTNDSPNPNLWTPVGQGTAMLPVLTNTVTNIPVISAPIDGLSSFAVEVIIPTSAVFGQIAGLNSNGSGTTFVRAFGCDLPGMTDLSTVVPAPNNDLALAVNGTLDEIVLRPNSPSTPEADSDFAIGTYALSYIATDAAGNTSTCSFSLTVSNFGSPVGSMACNDLVQISLDDDCVATVTPDQLLEGGPYSCLEGYTVTIFNQFNQPIGNVLTKAHVGQTLNYEVVGPNTNKCWGKILVEDKLPVTLECEPIYTTCSGSLTPGSPLPNRITFSAPVAANEAISSGLYSKAFNIDVFGIEGASIQDIDVVIDIEHGLVSDLTAVLVAPNGATSNLFVSPGADCTRPNMFVTLDDEAMLSNQDLVEACEETGNGIFGTYQPITPLTVFDGQDPEGTWQIIISDVKPGDIGRIRGLSIVISQSGATMRFPTSRNITFTQTGESVFVVNGIDLCGPATLSYLDRTLEESCSSIYSRVIERTWNAVDAYGNTSEPCQQLIYVYRNSLTSIVFPPNFDDIQEPALSCKDFGTTVPPTSVTGVPGGDICSNVQVFAHEDVRFDICQNSYKILRKFRILEWCTNQVIEHFQVIKVADKEGPVVQPIQPIILSAKADECNADVLLPAPVVTFDCTTTRYEVSYTLDSISLIEPPSADFFIKDGVESAPGGLFVIRNLPVGVTTVRYEIFDDCGNSTVVFTTVTITDNVPPIPVCIEFTKVSIGANGLADVHASSFDNGSWDNCGPVTFRARKMTNQCEEGTTVHFRDRVVFCCEEVGTTIMVELEITDLSNNRNFCMVEIKVEDKLPPFITKCPSDITLDCHADFKDLGVTGEPEFVDNCAVVDVRFTDTGAADQCGEGVITRTWTVEDAQGFTNTCLQRITLRDASPFGPDNIIWPADYEGNVCFSSLDPSELPAGFNFPVISDEACSLTSASYRDQVFSFVDGSCVKILRTWTVIDWCTYQENTSQGVFTKLQIVKLSNNVKPVFTDCFDKTVFSFGNCEGQIEFTINATDDCTPASQLKYRYTVDLFDDGTIQTNLGGTGNTVRGLYPNGVHRINWIVEDACGNVTHCTHLLIVDDGKKPTPYCHATITTVVMPSSGMISIWASDFDFGSFDNCTPQDQLIFSFSPNVLDTQRVITCADIPDGVEGYIPVEMWVTDAAGNQEFCSVGLIVQDNTGNVCDDQTGNFGFIGGRVMTAANTAVRNSSIELYRADNMIKNMMTPQSGNYNFNGVPLHQNYRLKGRKTNDVTNGLTTLDLVLIQRHILASERLNSPFKIIAADFNNDERITTADLVALRKVILGVDTKLPNNRDPWLFLDSKFTFADPNRPWPYKEGIDISNFSGNMLNQNLTAVKIGDVNYSATVNVAGDGVLETRSNEQMEWVLGNPEAKAGESFEIPVTAGQAAMMAGTQLAIQFPNQKMVFSNAIAGAMDITLDNFGFGNLEYGLINFSWNKDEAIRIDKDQVLFTLVFEALEGGTLADQIRVNNEILAAEAYDADLNVMPVVLRVANEGSAASSLVLYQNVPNPFMDETRIEFYTEVEAVATIQIFDVTGKRVLTQEVETKKGTNQVKIHKSRLGQGGMYFYELNHEGKKLVNKMIMID